VIKAMPGPNKDSQKIALIASADSKQTLVRAFKSTRGIFSNGLTQAAMAKAIELNCARDFAKICMGMLSRVEERPIAIDCILRTLVQAGLRKDVKKYLECASFEGAAGWRERIEIMLPREGDSGKRAGGKV